MLSFERNLKRMHQIMEMPKPGDFMEEFRDLTTDNELYCKEIDKMFKQAAEMGYM